MARGWESKSAESQAEDALERRSAGPSVPPPTPEQRHHQARINNLQLSRTRVLGEIDRCAHPRFRAQLERELAFLESELARLTVPSGATRAAGR